MYLHQDEQPLSINSTTFTTSSSSNFSSFTTTTTLITSTTSSGTTTINTLQPTTSVVTTAASTTAGDAAVMDPLRYPVQNGDVTGAGNLSSHSTDKTLHSVAANRNNHPSTDKPSAVRSSIVQASTVKPSTVRASPAPTLGANTPVGSLTSSATRATGDCVPPQRHLASSSTQPTNLTVLNINSSKQVSNKQLNLGTDGQFIHSNTTLTSNKMSNNKTTSENNSQQTFRSPQAMKKQNQPSSSPYKIIDPQFASKLTSALLENKKLENVDLGDSIHHTTREHLNTSVSKDINPKNNDSNILGKGETKKGRRKLLPKTPAPSIDISGQSILDSFPKMSLNLSNLDSSQTISEVYEPEPVDFPSSPAALLAMSSDGGVRLADEKDAGNDGGEEEDEDLTPRAEEYDAGGEFTAVASPPTGKVALMKTQQTPTSSKQQQHRQQPQQHRQQQQQQHLQQSQSQQSQQSQQTQQQQQLQTTKQQQARPHRKKLLVSDELLSMSNDDEQPSIASLVDDGDDDDDDDETDNALMLSHDDINDMMTPDDVVSDNELQDSIMERLGPETPEVFDSVRGLSEEGAMAWVAAAQGWGSVGVGGGGGSMNDDNSYRAVVIAGIEKRIDLQVIEPYKKVLSHGGHLVSGEAIIVFSACFLPDRARHDYDYVMDHLFMYVLTTLDQLIAEDYVLVYLHGATTRANMPSFGWLKRCYQMIDRRLRKNLQALYLVHPTFWVKTVVVMIRPFVSAKFSRKLRFVPSLKDLAVVIPMGQVCIPSRIKQYDEILESLLRKENEPSPAK